MNVEQETQNAEQGRSIARSLCAQTLDRSAFQLLCRRIAFANALHRAGLLDVATWARWAAWAIRAARGGG